MALAEQPCYTLINIPTEGDVPNEMALRTMLTSGTQKDKIEAVKRLIMICIAGDKLPNGMLMTVMQSIPMQKDAQPSTLLLKKLSQFFWEVAPKYGPDGKLLTEMILVCETFRGDLRHPNEFVRGSTLRFLCKIKEPELLEPLMSSVRGLLKDRHAYVKRNAVLAIFTIYKNFEELIPDAPELIANFLEEESDASCKRNAFMMLIHVDQERALSYLSSCIDRVTSFNDILQLVIVELIYKVCHANPTERSRFIRCIYNLLNSNSAAVRFEAATTLLSLTNAPTAVKAVASCYIDLIVKESDNNVKLIVLNKLVDMREDPVMERVLQEMVMDVLRVLGSSDLDVKRKTLSLALDLVTLRTVQEMVLFLKKEVLKSASDAEQEGTNKYRQLLVRTLHQSTIKFPDVAPVIIPVLAEFLSDTNELAASDVLIFLREAIQRFPTLQPLVLSQLIETLGNVKNAKIYRAAFWLLGEFAATSHDIRAIMEGVKKALGDIPIVDDEIRRAAGTVDDTSTPADSRTKKSAPRVTADGTYATESAMTSTTNTRGKKDERPVLRRLLLDGDFFIASTIASALTKLALRYIAVVQDKVEQNRFVAETMLVMAAMMHLGRSSLPEKAITEDDYCHMAVCLRTLAERLETVTSVFTKDCRQSLADMLELTREKDVKKTVAVVKVQTDTAFSFLQLIPRSDAGVGEDLFEATLSAAILGTKKEDPLASSKLNKVTQLTGFSDPVYAEAYVNVNQYDIVLDVFVVNQTGDTLQGLTLEVATVGDLKLVEKPQTVTLPPHDFVNMKTSIKVASTENGIIFGNLVYDVKGAGSDRCCVVLNDIHIDIMDYIMPASCAETEFRQMWADFEWENKININTNITNIREFLDHLLKTTNMASLTPAQAMAGECGFLTANLYAKSIFGEDVLANVSLEKLLTSDDTTTVTGHIRIRAKSQGMALSMGDKVNHSQKKKMVEQ